MQFLRRSRVGVARKTVRASERRVFEFTRVRIGRSIIMYEIRRRGEEDAWFHLPIANRNRNPAQNRNDRYILRRSGRIEPAAYRIRPLRALKSSRCIQSYSVHSALRDPRFPPRIPPAKYFANIALTTILLCLSSGYDFIQILLHTSLSSDMWDEECSQFFIREIFSVMFSYDIIIKRKKNSHAIRKIIFKKQFPFSKNGKIVSINCCIE